MGGGGGKMGEEGKGGGGLERLGRLRDWGDSFELFKLR